ncbi:hypothetical protein GX51_03892 [Blastomyces parvus]|uniref:Uncharacterized protein n=1 Tax=Blastomyces parvus TaxID=2060905 RepID=A0A2B7X4R8_9EURO|nr:hypothetical protein GX51_03892 [Blastomyces parvus]
MFLWNLIFLGSTVFTLQWRAAEARVTSGRLPDPDLPGHSDKWKVKGSSGYGCQVRDSEIISPRNPDRSGEDDGTLWTGETVFNIKQRPINASNGLDGLDTVCSGIYRMPTVFWAGPPTQGSNGTGNKFALGMIAWETNDTDKSNAWHVYRPCPGEGSDEAFLLRALVHYNNGSKPPDDATLGLNLIAPPPGNETSNPRPSQQIFFNGTYNGIKESDEYLGKAAVYLGSFIFTEKLNCTSSASSGDDDFGLLANGGDSMPPGTTVNGALANDTIFLRLAGSRESRILKGEETENTTTVTNIIYTKTDFDITFNGVYDVRNSSQRLVVNTSSENAISFIGAGTRLYPSAVSFFSILLFCSFHIQL